MKLSKEQQSAMEALKKHKILVRAKGGYWTCEALSNDNPPAWYYGTRTIQAL